MSQYLDVFGATKEQGAIFEDVTGKQQTGIAIFEWGGNGWAGATTFTPNTMGYLDKVRLGKLIHQKKTAP